MKEEGWEWSPFYGKICALFVAFLVRYTMNGARVGKKEGKENNAPSTRSENKQSIYLFYGILAASN